MAIDPLTAVLNIGNTIIDRLIPDKTQAAAYKQQLLQLQLQGDLEGMKAQLQVDQAEAASSNKFAADWRPMFGYICAFAVAYSFILQPFTQTILVCFHIKFDPTLLPKLDLSVLMPIALGMLGIGGIKQWGENNGNGNGH